MLSGRVLVVGHGILSVSTSCSPCLGRNERLCSVGTKRLPGPGCFFGCVSIAVRPPYLAISQLVKEIAGPQEQRDLVACAGVHLAGASWPPHYNMVGRGVSDPVGDTALHLTAYC